MPDVLHAFHLQGKDYHKLRPCLVEKCPAVITRLSSHLQSHKFPKHSELQGIASKGKNRDVAG